MTTPLISVMIPTHNCAIFLRETLISVLAQDLGQDVMQIEVIDDFSTKDDPGQVVKELGQGRVVFYRQPHNKGHVGNFLSCLERAKGKYLHILHGDDKILPGFYKNVLGLLETDPTIGAVFCRHNFISEKSEILYQSAIERNETGILDDFLEKICTRQILQTPSIVVRKSVYSEIGFFRTDLIYTEDWEMWARIGRTYKIGFIPEILAEYRIQSNSNTNRYTKSGEYVQDLKRVLHIVNSYLPEEKRKASLKLSLRIYSGFIIDIAGKNYSDKNYKSVIKQFDLEFWLATDFKSKWNYLLIALKAFGKNILPVNLFKEKS